MAQDPTLPGAQGTDQGLANVMEPQPDLSAPPAVTPVELEERKNQWRDVLGQIQNDPNMMRSIAVMGIRMMQPGASFGEGAAAGLGAFEAGRGAQQELERQQMKDVQESRLKDVQIRQAEQTLGQGAAKHVFELQKLQGEVDAIPDEAKKRKAQLQLDALKLAQAENLTDLDYQKAYYTVQNLIATGKEIKEHGEYYARGGSATGKKPAAEIEAEKYKEELDMYKQVVREEATAAGKPMSEAQVFVEAQRRYNASRYGQPTTLKTEATKTETQQKAIDFYNLTPQGGPGTPNWYMMSPEQQLLWGEGKRLAGKEGAPTGDAAPSGAAAPQRTVIVRNPTTGKLEVQKVK